MYANINNYLGMYHIPESSLNNEFENSSLPAIPMLPTLHRQPPLMVLASENVSKSSSSSSLQNKKSDPKVWGPAFWFTLHTSSAFYPEKASPIVKERMKNRILAIPYEIPCSNCRVHAIDFIEKHRDKLDMIVSGKHSLGSFYVDFHNQVNKRYGKPIWTYEQAYKLYSGEDLS